MCVIFFCLACCLLLPITLNAQVSGSFNVQKPTLRFDGNAGTQAARSFLVPRLVATRPVAELRLHGMQQRSNIPHLKSANQAWQPLGPYQIITPQFGDVTGRVTSIAIAPWDASGNTVYIGTTGGGVWLSQNAAASDATTVTFRPLTDHSAAFSGSNVTSLSIGAVSLQPDSGPDGVVLAGTGDPNDVLDSYYGAGILRSADGGTTWSLITQSSDAFSGGITNYSFVGDAFSGFAWSTTNTNVVVAGVTTSYDGFINNINNSTHNAGAGNVAEAGLYYSTDAGQTWHLSTIEDGPNKVIQSSQTTLPHVFPGVPVTSVIWNPIRKMFYAAVQFHGYYQSPDGVTWTRMLHQPGSALSSENCPFSSQSSSCQIFRGVLAVQPVTGDMFALTVGTNAQGLRNVDQGLWEDQCNANINGCLSPVVQFGIQIPDSALNASNGTIPNGSYNLTLAAVPDGTNTLLFAGTQDIFRCSMDSGCLWRNTTNIDSCNSGHVAPAQHAIVFLSPPAGKTLPLLYFGNDGGLWRSSDAVAQTDNSCAASDALHYQNLNDGLGSLAEVTGLANSGTDANVLLAGFGVNGSAAMTTAGQTAWPQLASGEGGLTAIDAINPDNWYLTLGPSVAIGRCTQGVNCTETNIGATPAIGSAETNGDQSLLVTPYVLDPENSSQTIIGTCRVWRGPSAGNDGGDTWSAANAISPMLDGHQQPSCNNNALIKSLAAGGTNMPSGTGTQSDTSPVIYAGMAGLLDGGGAIVGGHVFSTTAASIGSGMPQWNDLALSPVSSEQSYNGIFNPYHFDVSSLFVDPHDSTGDTVYATIQGFGAPHLYLSRNAGAEWINITQNLPDLPLNDVLVDPDDANVVYVASDGGVFVTQNVASCEQSGGQCWNIMGTGLPLAPVLTLTATLAGGGLLRAGTYGRGIWQVPLLSEAPQTSMSVDPPRLTFTEQAASSSSAPQVVTLTNTGTAALIISEIIITGDFRETNNCNTTIAPNDVCQISVTFNPSTSGDHTGTLRISGNITGGQSEIALDGTATAASSIVVIPSNMIFGQQQIDTTSSPKQVTISNTSTTPISLFSETITGPFSIQHNTCSQSLAPNVGCTLTIVFQPKQLGPMSGLLTVTTSQGVETVSSTGTGESPMTDTLMPSALAFPATVENTSSEPQLITLTNNGGMPLTGIQIQVIGDFEVMNGCSYSLNPQSACTLTVRYTPHLAGNETGSIVLTDNLRTQTIPLTGTGITSATDTLSSTTISFPVTIVGSSAPPQTVLVTNSGEAPLTQLTIHSVGTGFSQTNNCNPVLPATSTCTITITFHPIASGDAVGQIDITDSIRTQVISLSASAEDPSQDNLSPRSLTFGNQPVGIMSTPQTIILSNNSQAQLSGISLQSNNADFPFTTTCKPVLGAGSSCSIQVSFLPQTFGPNSGLLMITDYLRSQYVSLSGTGELPNVSLSPEALSFGPVGIHLTSAAQSLTLYNGSKGTLSGISIQTSDAFAEADNCGPTLSPGSHCSIVLSYTPVTTGIQNGTITIDSANSLPLVTHLSGTGINFQLSPTSATSTSVSNGGSSRFSFELIPANGSEGNATINCGPALPNSRCSVSPATASLHDPSSIQVTVDTNVAGTSQIHRASFIGGFGWPFAFCIITILLEPIRRRSFTLQPWMYKILMSLLLLGVSTGIGACGQGGGLLGAGVPQPLRNNSTTPPGVYNMLVTAEAGGLQKSVNLTLQVK